jgi:hypothetical protein
VSSVRLSVLARLRPSTPSTPPPGSLIDTADKSGWRRLLPLTVGQQETGLQHDCTYSHVAISWSSALAASKQHWPTDRSLQGELHSVHIPCLCFIFVRFSQYMALTVGLYDVKHSASCEVRTESVYITRASLWCKTQCFTWGTNWICIYYSRYSMRYELNLYILLALLYDVKHSVSREVQTESVYITSASLLWGTNWICIYYSRFSMM